MKKIVLSKSYQKEEVDPSVTTFMVNLLKKGDVSYLDLFNGESYWIDFREAKMIDKGLTCPSLYKVDVRDKNIYIDGFLVSDLIESLEEGVFGDRKRDLALSSILQLTLNMLIEKECRIGGNDASEGGEQSAREYKPNERVYIRDYKYVYDKNREATRSYNKIADEWTVRGFFRTSKLGVKHFVKSFVKSFK